MKRGKVMIKNRKTAKGILSSALLDTGAKRTYITMEKAKMLGLKWGPSKRIKLNTFGSDYPSDMYTYETTFDILQKDGSIKTIRAKVCKTITGAIMKQQIDVNKYKSVWRGLDMADDLPSKGGKFNIDILLGN